MPRRIIVDLDGTLTIECPSTPYDRKLPNLELVARLREYQQEGFEIVVSTARNMRTFSGNVGKINAITLPTIIDWLKKHDVPYDEILVGKPWCGTEGFYVDDKAIRPDEFVSLSYQEIGELLSLGKSDGNN